MISEEELTRLSYRDAPKLVTKIPDPIARQLLDEADTYESPTRAAAAIPIVWNQGLGATVRDVDGNVFIDLTAGVAVSAVGRLHPKVVEVIRNQSAELMHSIFINPRSVELAKKLSKVMPEGLRDSCFICYTTSGSAAIETAIKYARAITGRKNFVAFHGAYHGVWLGSLALTTSRRCRSGYEHFLSSVFHAPYGYCYRCFARLEYPSCGLN
jgi:4-aminobutyrate aminotransferase